MLIDKYENAKTSLEDSNFLQKKTRQQKFEICHRKQFSLHQRHCKTANVNETEFEQENPPHRN